MLRGESGVTLVELVVAMALTLALCGAALYWILVSTNEQNNAASRTFAARQAETGLEQLMRDLREAMYQDSTGTGTYSVTVSTSSVSKTTSIAFDIPTPGADTTAAAITWTCPSTDNASTYVGSCTRTLGGLTKTEIAGVQSASFAPLNSSGSSMSLPATNPAYIGATVKVQIISQLDHTQPATHVIGAAKNLITVQGGTDLRNFT